MGFMDKMKDLVGITDEYDDDYDNISQEEIDAYKNELRGSAAPAPAAAAAAPEPPISTGISPLAFSEVAPPQKFTENKENSIIAVNVINITVKLNAVFFIFLSILRPAERIRNTTHT
jgi:hypothetical protein